MMCDDRAKATQDRLARDGAFECAIITGGGTGTFAYELAGGVHNEIQPVIERPGTSICV